MSKCKANDDGKHFFHTTVNNREEKLGSRQEYTIKFWLTCIACGERRAITDWGELLVKKLGRWEEQSNV